MDLDDSEEQAAFRTEVRAWLAKHRSGAPAQTGDMSDAAYVEERRLWQRMLVDAGLAGVTWPVEHAGGGKGPLDQVVINQEIARAGVPGVLDLVGIGMLGPCLMAHGSDAQKDRYLGPMLRADEVWCQLFSEPAAGSDLAAVQTRARRDANGSWAISGQKVWTSAAHYASFGLLLARTDPEVPKHQGLSMFVVPMDAPGVVIRGLRQITGEAEFNEVFFDDVIVGDDAVVGRVGGGWSAALTVLMFERLTLGLDLESFGYRAERFAEAIADDAAASCDPAIRGRLGDLATELLAVRFAGYRTLSGLTKGQVPGAENGLVKVTTVNAAIAAGELIADVLGPDALEADSEWQHLISFLPGLKSAGGTEAILRNTVGERVLGLPAEPRLDKGVSFSESQAMRRAASF